MNLQFLLHPILFNHWKSLPTLNSTSCSFTLSNHPLPQPPVPIPSFPFSFFQKPPASFSQLPFPTGIKYTALSTGDSNPNILYLANCQNINGIVRQNDDYHLSEGTIFIPKIQRHPNFLTVITLCIRSFLLQNNTYCS